MNWLITLSLAILPMTHALTPSSNLSSLSVIESYTLPLSEISGLAWRVEPKTKKRQLIVVGDRSHTLLLVDWDARKKGLKYEEVNLDKISKSIAIEQSEWESVFCDETGRVFIVQEHPSQILVVSADLKRIETVISLKSAQNSDVDWEADVNSKGEGLLPLKNGHILVVKEKLPLSIVEFAPQGNKAQGYTKDLSIEKSGVFPFEKVQNNTYTAVHSWRFTPETELLLEDSSGINVDMNGELYLLGDQKNVIVKIGAALSTKEKVLAVKSLYSLPSILKQPEGMAIDELGHPIIALDRKNTKKPNLFLLSPLK